MNTANRFGSFHQAAGSAFRYLHGRVDLDAWLVARVHESSWIVTDVDDRAFGLKRGHRIQWTVPELRERRRTPQTDRVRIADGTIQFPGHLSPASKPLETVAVFPLSGDDGKVIGVLCGLSTRAFEPGAELCELADLIAGFLGRLMQYEIERTALTRTSERFRFQAMTDALTDLPNRRAWEERLQDEQHLLSGLREPNFISVIDLDSLKEINDRSGHHAGDKLLREAAHVLRGAVRDSDFVARVGGDEFAVLGLQSGAVDASWLSQRFGNALKAAGISASVGTVLAEPGQPLKWAWEDADRAMYREKRERANTSRQRPTG